VYHEYTTLWIYLISPILEALGGTWTYNFIRHPNKPTHGELTKIELTKIVPFLRRNRSHVTGSNDSTRNPCVPQFHNAVGFKCLDLVLTVI